MKTTNSKADILTDIIADVKQILELLKPQTNGTTTTNTKTDTPGIVLF